jgi:signal transduction histidine kinase
MNERLELEVRDDGPGLPPSGAAHGHGIGLANTRARLAQLYGDAATLALANGERGGAVVTMTLPFRIAEGAGGETEEPVVHAVVDAHR